MTTVPAQEIQNYGRAPQGWNDCAICLDVKNEDLRGHKANEQVVHKYHQSCINEWLKNKMSCPVCRVPLKTRQVKQIQDPFMRLEISIPQLISTPKAYIQEISNNLSFTAGLSIAFAFGDFLGRRVVPLNPLVMFLGGGIGFAASRAIRNHLEEVPIQNPENEFEKIRDTFKSKAFMGAIGIVGFIGAFGVTGSLLISTLPIVLAGMTVHYGLKKLHENEVISDEAKTTLQKASAIFTMAYGLVNPLKSLISIGLGAVAGAFLENEIASARSVQTEV